MTFEELLSSLTPEERDFIASLDYGADKERHRAALDVVLANGGVVELDTVGVWYPYEVIELGKSALQPGHEREFAACMGIVLLNVKRGGDRCNLEEDILGAQRDALGRLPEELRRVLAPLMGS
jgi:hypothetical protein